MDEGTERHLRRVLIIAIGLMTIGGIADLIMDRPRQWLSFHVVFESLIVAGGLTAVTSFWLGWWRAEHASERLRRSLHQQRAERDAWKASAQQALAGFGSAIDEQFTRWHLTPAEREVALLLLKGRSHKAIAQATGRSSATVRQHATVVYQKAGLAGRAELAAYFLEDVVLPPANAPTSSA